MPKLAMTSLVFCAVIPFVGFGCNGKTEDANPKVSSAGSGSKPEVLYEVRGKKYVEEIELRGGSVHGYETTDVMAKVAGYVKKIHVDIGMKVEQGQLLVELDVPEMIDELIEKNAMVTLAKAEVDKADAAIKQASADLASRVAGVDAAKAYETYQEKLYMRFEGLTKVVDKDRVAEAKYAWAAAIASVSTADAQEKAADAKKETAIANREVARANESIANATLKRLKTMQEYTRITAPFKGTITKRMVDHGAFVRPPTNSGAMPLFTITRIDKIRLVVSVPSSKVASFAAGATAEKITPPKKIRFEKIGGLRGIAVNGVVSRTAVALQRNRMLRIEIDIPNPAEDIYTQNKVQLLPGMYGTVTAIIEEYDMLPRVPVSAVRTDSDGRDYVMVAENGEKNKQYVEVAFNDAEMMGIKSGLEVGAMIVQDISDASKY